MQNYGNYSKKKKVKEMSKILVKIWPYLFIVLIWFVFALPVFTGSKIPFSSTYLTNFFTPWSAYSTYVGPVKNNAMPDVISQIIPWKMFTIDTLKSGEIPFWNPYSFSGTNHLANYQSAVLSPFNLLFFVFKFVDAWSILVLLQPLLAGIFMLLFLRAINLQKIPAVLGAVSFMFCGFLTTWMDYATLGYAILFLPLALFSVEKFYSTQNFKYLFLLAFTFPLSFFSGHFQISVYFLMFVFFYLLFKLWEEKNVRQFLYTLLYSIFGMFLALPQVLPSIEIYSQSLRSTIFQKNEAIPFGYLITVLAPDFLGNPVTRNDWFGHYAEWNGYVGTLVLLLSFFSVFYLKYKKILFFVISVFVSLALCINTPFVDLIVSLKIPVISTSALSRIIVLASFSLAVLGAYGFEYLNKDLKKNFVKVLVWLGGLTSFFGFIWIVILLKLFIPVDKVIIAKQNFILPTVMFLLLVGWVMLWYFFNRFNKLKYITVLSLLLIFVVAFEMLRFANKWQEFGPKSLFYPSTPITNEYQKLFRLNRFFGNMGTEEALVNKLQSIEGYDAVYLKRYGEFISAAEDGNLHEGFRSVVLFPKNGKYAKQTLDFLGVKYIVHKIADGRNVWVYPFWKYPNSYKLIYDDGVYQIFENNDALPRVFTVNKYFVVNDAKAELRQIFADKNLKENLYLEENPGISLNAKRVNTILTKFTANSLSLESDSDGKTMLFISNPFAKGWNAYIDGSKVKIYRANYAFQAIVLPQGVHKIDLVFQPISFIWGIAIAVVGIILMVLVFVLRGKIILLPRI